MFQRKKLWLAIGATLIATTGCAEEAPQQSAINGPVASTSDSAEGGEGGEAGASSDANIAEDNALYRTYLALMRGHLHVGLELYRNGAQQAAATHMKHPKDELYMKLLPGMQARGATGFAEELSALTQTVESSQPVSEADAAYQDVLAAITQAEAAAETADADTLGRVILQLVKTAAEEYDIAVKDGQLVNAHEYQDAMGFVKVAGDLNAQLKATGNHDALAKLIDEQLAVIQPAWPALIPPKQLNTEASLLYGAAARIELGLYRYL